LKANIIHRDLNPCGGGERLSIAVMMAISEIGIDFDFTSLEVPKVERIKRIFGTNFALAVQKASDFHILESALSSVKSPSAGKTDTKYDLTINTHVDALPYYRECLTEKNSIVQCHFPTAIRHLQSNNTDYLKETREYMEPSDGKSADPHNITSIEKLWSVYLKLMQNSTVLTNSHFSKKAIKRDLGICSKVLSPPVDIEPFRRGALWSGRRKNTVLVLSRIVPYKKIENAIIIANMLRANQACEGLTIVGNIYDDDFVTAGYYEHLIRMVKALGLNDFVRFRINASLETVIENMATAKIYLHTMFGESFGISTVEAMAAGLTPVVPDIGGHTEFVPKRNHYSSLAEAADIISSEIGASCQSRRIDLSNTVGKFSVSNYISGFKKVLDALNN
jgi:glycosyltransferase involved in cell wall biosynthesis